MLEFTLFFIRDKVNLGARHKVMDVRITHLTILYIKKVIKLYIFFNL